ncbi:uroporphyrinogen decarboxylase [Clostridia bacterium]|nr:uroporphyrinogen decarboxylase [Clostridia bacterium]
MLSKERVKTAFSRKEPDRVPITAEFVPEVQEKLLAHFGSKDGYEMAVALGCDVLFSSAGIGTSYYGEGEEYVCPWGATWKYFENEFGRYTEIVDRPLENDEDGRKLEAYRIPDPEAESVYLPARDLVSRYGDTHFICGSIPCSIFEASWYLHGLEDTIVDMLVNPDYANSLFDKMMQFPLRAGLKLIDEKVDMLWLGDDVGMQQKMFMAPETWREFLKPRMAALIKAFKGKNPEIIVAYHSCGYIVPIIEDLIEIGLDVLNPVQPHAMDALELKKKFGDRLSFWGAIDIQNTLPRGSRRDIRNEVALRMRTIGKGGGYLMAPAHNVQADTSVQNILDLFEAARELGMY